MIKDNKICILCGKKYSFCNRCEEYDHLPRWMAIYCSENCKNIFNTISGYNMKLKTKEEAASALGECDLSKKSQFNFDFFLSSMILSDNVIISLRKFFMSV